MRSAVRLALPIVAPACSTSGASASDDPVRIDGHVAFEVYEAPICGDAGVSLLDRCSRETYTGSIEGDGDTAVTGMDPVEPAGVLSITENEVIHLVDGDITAKVNAVYHGESPDRPYISMHVITGGNGKYAQASGYIRLWGYGGNGPADYLAVIRLAK